MRHAGFRVKLQSPISNSLVNPFVFTFIFILLYLFSPSPLIVHINMHPLHSWIVSLILAIAALTGEKPSWLDSGHNWLLLYSHGANMYPALCKLWLHLFGGQSVSSGWNPETLYNTQWEYNHSEQLHRLVLSSKCPEYQQTILGYLAPLHTANATLCWSPWFRVHTRWFVPRRNPGVEECLDA